MERAAEALATADRRCREAGEEGRQASLEAYRAAFAGYCAAHEAWKAGRLQRCGAGLPSSAPGRPLGFRPADFSFVPGTAERLDDMGTRRSVELEGYGRIAFHVSRVRRASRCAVTGTAIPKGALALLPDDPEAVRADAEAGPVRVSLEGWGRLEGGR